MKQLKINGKNLLGYNKREVIKEIQTCSKLDKDTILAYDDISNVYFLFTIEGWNCYKQFNFIYHIKSISCKDYNNLSLKKIEEKVFQTK